MSVNECAPYATARTSILVYKGKGILVKRALSRDDAIKDAISEFDIPAGLNQIYLTSYVGAQGQEVEISKSAFAFIRDTVPIHVHLREEDDGAERPRWPALPLAGLIQESPKPEAATQPAAPSRFPHLFGLVGGEGSKTTESKIASKIESISDWQRHATGTPDTSASVHRARLDQAPHTKSPAGPAASSEEMLSETAMNSLVNGYAAEASLLPASLTESQASSATPNNAGKAWNWFKRAGSAIKPPALPSSLLNHETSQTVVEKSQNHVLPEIKLKEAIQPMIRELPRRPSKHDMQTHKHTHSRSKPSLKQATNKITAEIETLLQDQPPTLREAADPMFTAEDPESWGPGALVLDDGISESSVPFDASQGSQNPPWWARPVDALDERSRRKLGLKPLHLKRNDQAKSGVSKNENGPKERERNDRAANRPPPLFTSTGANKAIDSGKVSPGVPLAGQRRTRNSKLSMREAEHEHARPLPADIPESPFSSRRFSKVATVRLGHRAAPSRALVPQDAVPEDADAPPTMQIPAGRQAARKPDSKEAYSHAGLTESSKSVPLSKVVATGGEASREAPKPIVPVATRPQLRPMPSSRSASQQSGTFAAAAMAARRNNTGARTIVKQRTSLSSLKDFVPAELPQMDKRHVDEIDNEDEDEESTTVYVQRLVLGPMDLTSPNRKGSKLIMKPKLASSQLVLEWQAESKVVLNLPFDAVSALQLPDPECSDAFIIIKTTTGEVCNILIEVDAENLLLFQRFVLVFIMGMGADMELISPQGFIKACRTHGW